MKYKKKFFFWRYESLMKMKLLLPDYSFIEKKSCYIHTSPTILLRLATAFLPYDNYN